jgi:hypothetical protein
MRTICKKYVKGRRKIENDKRKNVKNVANVCQSKEKARE